MTAGPTLDDLAPGHPPGEALRRHLALDPRQRLKRTAFEAQKEATWAAANQLKKRALAFRGERDRKKGALEYELSGVLTGSRRQEPAPEDPRQQELIWMAEELGRLEKQSAEAEERRIAAARVYNQVFEYLENADPAAVVPVVVPYERLADPRAELATVREQLEALTLEASRVEHAPVPTAEAAARMRALLRRESEAWTANVGAFFAARGPQTLREVFSADLLPDQLAVGSQISRGFYAHLQLLLALVGDELMNLYADAIGTHATNGEAVGSAERPRLLKALAEKRAECERREEQIILCAERDGLELMRRGEADPAIVLCTVLA
jgi:hypothetical protein